MPKLAKILTAPTVAKLRPRDRAYDKRDGAQPGLVVRVHPSGKKVWMCYWTRYKAKVIDDVDNMSLADARQSAKEMLNHVRLYGAPVGHQDDGGTLGEFLKGRYQEWAGENLSNGLAEAKRVQHSFKPIAHKKLDRVTAFDIERVRRNRLKVGKAIETLNRETGQLRRAFNLAVDWHLIADNPMATVKQKKLWAKRA